MSWSCFPPQLCYPPHPTVHVPSNFLSWKKFPQTPNQNKQQLNKTKKKKKSQWDKKCPPLKNHGVSIVLAWGLLYSEVGVAKWHCTGETWLFLCQWVSLGNKFLSRGWNLVSTPPSRCSDPIKLELVQVCVCCPTVHLWVHMGIISLVSGRCCFMWSHPSPLPFLHRSPIFELGFDEDGLLRTGFSKVSHSAHYHTIHF